jgi:hypothetical protein
MLTALFATVELTVAPFEVGVTLRKFVAADAMPTVANVVGQNPFG